MMNLEEAETKARQAVQLLTEIHAERHDLAKLLPSNGRKAFMLSRFAAHDAAYLATRVVDLLSPAPVHGLADAGTRPMEVTAGEDAARHRLGG